MRKHERLIDIFSLLGLALFGGGVYLALGAAATLMFVGGVLLAFALVLAVAGALGNRQEPQP